MYAQLCSWDNLLLAYQKASRGKRGHPNVAAFEHRLEDNLLALQQELRDRTYTPGRYASFYIHEPKRRLISAAPFRDRVVHHALCNRIEPIFERSFIADSYANRLGKGTHRALDRCQHFARRYRYVLQCDVQQFFPAIDHKRDLRCPAYLRYVDDFLLFAEDKAVLWTWKAAIVERLAQLRLTIHPGAHPRPVKEGISFLGFVVFPDHRRLKRRKGVYFRRRLFALMAAYADGALPLKRITASVQGWVNHVRYANTVGLRRAVFGSSTQARFAATAKPALSSPRARSCRG